MVIGKEISICLGKNFSSYAKSCGHIFPPGINLLNYLTLSLEKKVAVAFYYLKDTGSIWMTANTVGIHQCTISKVILQFWNAVTIHLGPKYFHLPRTVDEMQTTVAEFKTKLE